MEVVRRDVQAHVLVDVVVLVKMLVQEHVKADANQVALVDVKRGALVDVKKHVATIALQLVRAHVVAAAMLCAQIIVVIVVLLLVKEV